MIYYLHEKRLWILFLVSKITNEFTQTYHINKVYLIEFALAKFILLKTLFNMVALFNKNNS